MLGWSPSPIAIRLEAIALRLEAIASRLAITLRLEAIAITLEAIASLEAMAISLEAIASRLEATASRLEAIAIRLEAMALRLEAIASTCSQCRLPNPGLMQAQALWSQGSDVHGLKTGSQRPWISNSAPTLGHPVRPQNAPTYVCATS